MKLIMEGASLLTGHYEDEMNESTGNTERNYYISGIFSTPEQKNRNGRVYSRSIWEREVQKYQKEINEKTVNTLGEWQHPPRSTVDPLKAVLRIVELKLDAEGNVVGRAKILNNNTEATNSIKGLIKEGIKIGVSSRGVGKVSATGVVEDFKLITYDAVDMPSDYNAMLNGVVEGYTFENGVMIDKEFQVDENGCVGEVCNMAAKQIAEAEAKDEPCPIAEKIESEVSEAKKEIIQGMEAYMMEAFKKISETNDSKNNELLEGINDYIDTKTNNLIENISDYLEGKTGDTDKSKKTLDESVAKKLIEALKKI